MELDVQSPPSHRVGFTSGGPTQTPSLPESIIFEFIIRKLSALRISTAILGECRNVSPSSVRFGEFKILITLTLHSDFMVQAMCSGIAGVVAVAGTSAISLFS